MGRVCGIKGCGERMKKLATIIAVNNIIGRQKERSGQYNGGGVRVVAARIKSMLIYQIRIFGFVNI
jgi:hypothetical protein